ncbi:MAG: hypothetical protein Kow00120_21430 [Anaerolineae bacterium]
MRRRLAAIGAAGGLALLMLVAGCQPEVAPTEAPPTLTPDSGIATMAPTWTPLPVTPSPVPTDTPPPTDTSVPPTPVPTDTPYPGCLLWQGVEVENQEEFTTGEPVTVTWPVMPEAEGYRFLLRNPFGRQIHDALVPQPPAGEQFVHYEIAPELLQQAGYGFGWQAAPFLGGEAICYPRSGEFSYIEEILP